MMPHCSHGVTWGKHPCVGCQIAADNLDPIEVDDAIETYANLKSAILAAGREYPHDPVELGMNLWTHRARMWHNHHDYEADLGEAG